MMCALVDVLKAEIEKNNVTKVNEVIVEVGELSFLAEEQMRFAYNTLAEDNERLAGSKFTFESVPAEIECQECGRVGDVDYLGEENHFRMPIIKCPDCDGSVSILKGRECQIKNMIAEVGE